jgi:hypothetical protein
MFSNNVVTGRSGGAIHLYEATADLNSDIFTSNSASFGGNHVYVDNFSLLTYCSSPDLTSGVDVFNTDRGMALEQCSKEFEMFIQANEE